MLFEVEGLVKTSLIVSLLLYVMISSQILAFTEEDKSVCDFQDEVLARYPGYFKTLYEVNAMEEEIRKRNQAVKKTTFAQEGVDVTDGRFYHGCCISETSLVQPHHVSDIKGNQVTVVQCTNFKQVVQNDTCVTVPDCDSCSCIMTPYVFTAVVWVDNPAGSEERIKRGGANEMTVSLVTAPSVCRCLRGASAYRPSVSSERTEL